MSNELFRIDEISNLGSSDEFSNVGKLIGGAKKDFSVGGARKKAEDKKLESPSNDEEVKTITMNNDTMETHKSPEEETPKNNDSPRNNKIVNVAETPENDIDDAETPEEDNDNDNDNEDNTDTKQKDTKKEIKKDEDTPSDEELEDLLSEGEKDKDDDENDNEDESNNDEKLKTALNNSPKEDNNDEDEGSMLNLTALKNKFYEMLIEMRNEEVDEDDHEDLKPLLHLFDDTKTRLAVLVKMRDDGMIKL